VEEEAPGVPEDLEYTEDPEDEPTTLTVDPDPPDREPPAPEPSVETPLTRLIASPGWSTTRPSPPHHSRFESIMASPVILISDVLSIARSRASFISCRETAFSAYPDWSSA